MILMVNKQIKTKSHNHFRVPRNEYHIQAHFVCYTEDFNTKTQWKCLVWWDINISLQCDSDGCVRRTSEFKVQIWPLYES